MYGKFLVFRINYVRGHLSIVCTHTHTTTYFNARGHDTISSIYLVMVLLLFDHIAHSTQHKATTTLDFWKMKKEMPSGQYLEAIWKNRFYIHCYYYSSHTSRTNGSLIPPSGIVLLFMFFSHFSSSLSLCSSNSIAEAFISLSSFYFLLKISIDRFVYRIGCWKCSTCFSPSF